MFDLDVQPQDSWRPEEPQRVYGSWDIRVGCVEEEDGKIGEAGERELVLWSVSVRCCKERDMTRG